MLQLSHCIAGYDPYRSQQSLAERDERHLQVLLLFASADPTIPRLVFSHRAR